MAVASCSDITGTTGVQGVVSIFYKGPPDTNSTGIISVTIGDTLKPAFVVTLNAAPQGTARYAYATSRADSSQKLSTVFDVIDGGSRIFIKGRGTDTLWARLLGATLGADTTYEASIIINASPKGNDIDSVSVSFNSLASTKTVTARSTDKNGASVPLLANSVLWSSDNPAVATVQKITADTARIMSVTNGSTWVRAMFDSVAVDSVKIDVQQVLGSFVLTTPLGIGGGGQITLTSLNDTVTVRASPVDPNGQPLLPGVTFAPPSFVSRLPEKATVNPTTGLVTAAANTDNSQSPARVLVTTGGSTPRSDSIAILVQQVATSILINGKRVDTLQSIGDNKTLTAIIKDARGNPVQLPPSWSSSDPAIAQYSVLASGDAAVGVDTGTVFIKVSRDQVRDSIVLVVRNDPDKVLLKPDTLLMKSVNDTSNAFVPTVTNKKGDALTSGITLSWSSLDTTVVKVLSDGRTIAKGIGSTDVVVSTSNGKTDASRVIVTNFPATVDITSPAPTLASIGDSTFLATTLANGRGAPLTADNTILTWTSSDVNIARPRIDGSGWVYAMGPGQAILRATSKGDTLVLDEVIVTVSNAAANITVAPAAPATLTSLGDQTTFTATVFNQAGAPITNATLRWSVAAGATFVSIDSITGVATALANGTATIRAASGSITKDVNLTVAQALSTTASTITPAAPSIVANGTSTTTITFQLKDARGNNLTFGGATVVPNTTRGTLGSVNDNGNGNYTATLTAATASGSAAITATVNGPALAATGLVSMTPDVAAQYLLSVAPSLAPIAGAQVTVSARLADVNGNLVATAGSVVTWGSSGGGSFSAPTSSTDATGLATITFTTNATVSQHIVSATTGSVTGTTNPPINPVAGAGANYLTSASTTSPVAGAGVTITAQLRDANGNNVALAGQTVTWSKSDANGSFGSPTSLTNASGIATVTFNSHTVSGTATTVTATTGGNTGTTGTITTVPGPASAAQTLITSSAPTVTAGSSVTITVQARDANGNNLSTNADAVSLAVAPTVRGTLSGVTSAGGGAYSATFTGAANGAATITGTINNVAITDNEVVTVAVGAASAAQSTASIPAGTAGSLNTITVQAKDANGNNLAVGGATVMVSITGANTVASFAATDNGNGTYTATYTPTVIGTDAVAITLGGTPIGSSPLSSVVAPGSLSTFLVEAFGGGAIGSQSAGVPFNIRITARDANGNIVQPFNGTVQLTSSGTLTGSPVTSAAFTNGILSSQSLTITNTGAFTITATSGSVGVSNAFTVGAGAASAAQTTASVPAGTAGAVTTISIQAKDANGNNRTSTSGAVAVSVTGANTTTASVIDNLDGTYTATYTPTVAGTDNIAITLSGSPISGSAFSRAVAVGALHHFNISTIPSQTAGAAFATTITAKDANNNTVTAFTGTVDITSSGALTGGTVVSGTFVAGVRTEPALTITNVGSFTITATRSGGSEAGTSNAFTVAVGAASAPASTASVPPNSIAGSLTTITVQAKDANGNNRTSTSGAVVVSVTGANIATASVTDNGNGTYTATYTPTVAGTDNVAITLGGVGIGGGPYSTLVAPAALHRFAVSAVGGAPIAGQTAGTSFNIRVVAQDANNNTVPSFTGTVDLTSTGTLTGAPQTSGAFTAGVLASQAVTLTNVGTFTITATRTSGGIQSGTSNSFVLSPGAAIAGNSTASVPAGTSALTTTITIQAKDANNNNRTTTSGAVVVSVTGANTATASVTDNLNGTYTATYTPTVAGTDNIAITLGGVAISGSPFSSVISPSSLHHFAVTNTSDAAIAGQTAGASFNIKIVAQDASNNTVPSFTGTVGLTSSGTLTGAPVTTGAFTAGVLASQAATITNTGSFTITATRSSGGAQTGTSNAFTVGAGAAAAATTIATVPAGTSGIQNTVSIQAKDANGNNVTTGGSTVVVSISGANTATPSVTDNGNGTYSASYTPTVAGTDNVAITLGGVGISGSPYSSAVSPGSVSNFLVEAFGGGAIATQTAGSSFNIRLTARDANNNTVTSFSGAGNTAQITSSGTLSAGNGTTAAFTNGVLASHAVTITNTGSWTITATRTAGTQSGSSLNFTVAPGAASAAQTVATVPAGTGGSVTTITVQAKDAFGNNRTSTSGTIAASITGANTATGNVVDNADGTYTVTYTPSSGGTDAISITLGGTPISGSPYSSVVGAGTLDHFQVDAQGGGAIGAQTAGGSFNIRIIAQDANNNTVPSFTGTVVLTSTGTLTGSPVTSAAFVNGVLASQSITVTNTGSFSVTATATGKNGTSNAFTVGAGAASAAQSTASVPSGTAGSLTTITVQAKDALGNNRTSTSGTLAATVTGANAGATVSITDNLNGSYTATYTPTVSGSDNIAITLGGSPINSSPFSSAVAVGALHHFAITTIASQTAGAAFSVTITAKDANNNTVTGFVGTADLTSTGTLTGAPVTTGAFTAGARTQTGLTITNTGSFTITATRTGNSETGTSNSFAVAAGAAAAAQSTGSVPTGIAGSLTTITVQAKDANGNNRTSTSGAVVVLITGANTATASVTDNLNGTYTASYTPTVAGTDNVDITLGGVAIGGSPFSSAVSPSTLHHFAVTNTSNLPIGSQAAGTSFNIKVVAQDANNNTVTGFTGTVDLTSTGTLTGAPVTTAGFTAGVLATQAITITNTGSFTVTATRTTGGVQSGTSSAFLVSSGAATALFLAQSPSAAPTAGVTFAQQPVVYVRDASGNVVTTDNTTVVTASLASGTGTLQGTTAVTAVNGVATFTNLSHNVANTITLQFTAGGLSTATSGSVVVAPAALDHFTFNTVAGQTAGSAFSVTITAQDVFNNTVTSFATTAQLTSTGTLTGTPVTTGAFTAGTRTQTGLTITSTGSFTLTATASGKTGTSNSFAVATGAANANASTATVPAGTAGGVTSITVQAKDANGNNRTGTSGTVVINITGANTATPTVTDNGDGTYSASYTPTVSGTDNVQITLGGTNINGGVTPTYTSIVSPGVVASFQVTNTGGAAIGTQTAGTSFNIRVRALDANGNVATSFTGAGNAVNITSTGTLSAGSGTTAAFTAGVLASHAVTVSNTGSFTLTATRATGGLQTGTSNSFAVNPGTAVAAQSSATVPSGTAGSATSIVVQAKDATGNNLTSGGSTVVISITGANTATPTVTDVGNGTYTASYTPTASGTDNVAITLGGTPISGSPYTSSVASGAINHYSVELQGGGGIPTQTAGTSFNVRVVAHDANDNVVTSYSGAGTAVNLTSTGTLTGTPVATGTFTNGVLASQAITLTNTGSFTVTATRIAGGAQTGTSNSFTVQPGAANANASTATVPAGTAGSVTTITVQAKDANGNNRTSTSGAVVVSITGANTATANVTDNLNGTYTATYTPSALGADNINITLAGVAINGGASPSYTSAVAVGALHHFTINTIGAQAAGTSFSATITAKDAGGNTVTGFGGTVSITSSGTLTGAPVTSGSFTAGVRTQTGLTITNTGSFTISVDDGSAHTGTSTSFAVSPGASAAAQSTASVPSAGTAGSLSSITIQAKDAGGNNRASGGDAIVVSVTGANTVSASVTDNSNGTYTATYTPTVSGTDNIAITLGGVAISGSPFTSTISPATLHHFAVTNTSSLPIGSQNAGQAFNIRVVAQDANNNTVTSFTGNVNLTSTGTLSGSPVSAGPFIAGVFASQAVTITNTGSFTITATRAAGGVQAGTSNAFTVAAGTATHLAILSQPSSTATGGAAFAQQPVIQVLDANNNVVTSDNTTVVTATRNAGTGTLQGTTSVTAVNGVATFANLAHNVAATISIDFAATSLTGATSNNVVVSPAGVDHFVFNTIASQVAGTSFSVTITAQDAFNNTATGFVSTVQLTSTGALSGTPVTTGAFTAGTRTQTGLTITNTGSFTLTADDGSSHTGTSNSFSVAAGAVSANASTASVPAGTAGSVTSIVVQAKDANGNNRTSTSGTVVVTITGANSATPSVTDNGDGTYTTSYTPLVAGTDNVQITLGGTNIAGGGTPTYTSLVAPGALHHFAFGAIASQTAGSPFTVAITAQDANNNTVTSFTGTVVLTSTGTLSGAPLTSGAFVAGVRATQSVTITNTGSFTLSATRSAGTEAGTSASFSVAAGSAVAAQSTASVPSGTAGSATSITVQAKDANGNNLTSGGSTVVVSITGANTATPSVTDNGNGTYSTSYTPTASGTDNVAITLGGSPISGSPYTSAVSAGALNHYSVENQGGGGIPSQTAGTSFNVRVVAHDANDNVVTSYSGAGTAVNLTSTGTLTGTPVATGTFTNGVYASQAVTITNTGSFTITATRIAGGVQTGTSNSFSVVTGAASAAQSTASVGAGTAGAVTSIAIQAKDANGNNRTSTSGAVVVSVTGANTATASVTDNLDGTYTATYTPTATGTDNIAITLGGVAISGSPYSSLVGSGLLDHFTFNTVSSQIAGTSFAATITAKDANNNTVTSFTGTVQITSTGTLTSSPVTTAAFVAGAHTESGLVITNTGSFTLTATGSSKTGTSNSFSVAAGAANAATSTAVVPAGTAGAVTSITVQVRDANGNARNNATGVIAVAGSVTGANTATPSVTDNNDGTYTLTYTPTASGTDNVAITMNTGAGATAISGSPFTSLVAPGALDHFSVALAVGGSKTAGSSFNLNITAQDLNNNTVTSFTGTGNAVNVTSTGTLTQGSGTSATFTNGALTHAVTISNTGSFTITATKVGGTQTGTSAAITVDPSTAAAAQSTASVPSGTAGSQTTVTIQAKDANGNSLTSGGSTASVTVSGANSVSATTATDNGNGTYTFQYTPTASGTDNVAITLGGAPISGSPYASAVASGALNHYSVENQGGGGIPSQTAGTSFNVRVVAHDANDNVVTSYSGAGTGVNLTSTGTLTGTPVATGTFTNGVYASQAVTITNTGSFTITATRIAGGVQTGTSNSFSVVTGAANAAQSTASVGAGTAGSVTSISIQAKDASGNNRTSTSGAVVVSVTGANTATASVTDNLDGTYTATYTPTATGTDNIAITLGGVAISGSPYSSLVGSGLLDHFTFNTVSSQIAGTGFAATITAKDVNNNTVTSFTGTVNITSTGTLSGTPVGTAAFVAGSHTESGLVITNTGSFTLAATGSGKTGTSNSFSVAAGAANPATSTASVPAGTAGSLTSITVQVRDANGNARSNATGVVSVAGSVTGANTATPSVTNNNDGTYTLTYTPTASGTDNVAITMNTGAGATAISGSPFTSIVAPGTLDHFSVALAVAGNKTAGTSFNVDITAQDLNNNTVTAFTGTGNAVNITSTGTLSAGSGTTATFTNGTLTHAVTISNTGSFTITATKVGGTQTGTSAAITVDPSTAAAAQSTASVPSGTAGSQTTVTIQAKDANGNSLTSGGSTVSVTVSGANSVSATSATDNGNGTYTFQYTPTASGTDNVAITLGGTPIAGSPYTSAVSAGALNHYSVENQGGGGIPSQTAGTSFNVRVVAHDANDNVVTSYSGTGTGVNLTSTGTLTGTPVATGTFTNGVYASQAVTITNTGSFTITATRIAGGAQTGTSNSFSVVTGAASAAQSTASVPAGTAGAATSIAIQAKDANGNNRTSTSGAVVVSVTGANTASASVIDNLDGTYTATYTPTATGTDNIAITLGGVAISGSPYSSLVGSGLLDHFMFTTLGAQTAGTGFAATITAQDANYNTVTSFTGTVNITSTGTLSGTPVGTAAFVAGSHTESGLVITNTGSFTLTATGSGKTGTSNAFSVAAGAVDPASSTATVPGTGTAGTATTITVQARDVFGNTRTNATGITAVAGSVTGANTATAGVVNNGNGTYTLTYTPTITGTDNIAITIDAGSGPVAITGSPFTSAVGPGAATHLEVFTQPSSTALAGIEFAQQPVIHVHDANHNIVTTDNGRNVTASRNAGPGVLQGTTTQATVNGVATFTDLKHPTVATITIQFAASGLSGVTSNNVVVSGATKYIVTPQFVTDTAGAYVIISAQLATSGNQPVAIAGKTVSWGKTGNGGSFVTPTSQTDADGIATIAFRLDTVVAANHHTVTATDNTTLTGTSVSISITSAAPHHFILGGTGTSTAGSGFAVSITAQDQYNNTASTYTGPQPLIFSGANVSPAPASVAPTATDNTPTPIAFSNTTNVDFTSGVGNSTVTLYNAEIASLNVTDGSISATTHELSVTVSADAEDHLTITTQPSTSATAEFDFTQQPVVQLRDAYDNLRVNDNTSTVTASRNVGTDELGGTVTVLVSGGIATFTNLSYPVAESITIDFTSSPGAHVVTSNSFAITSNAGVVTHFAVTNTADGAVSDQNETIGFLVKVVALDADNNIATGFTGTVDFTSSNGAVTITQPSGPPHTSGAFTAGELASESITLTGATNVLRLLVVETSGTKTGRSNSFTLLP